MVRGLERYKAILKGEKKPRFLKAKKSGALKEKITKTKKILEHCDLCERKCGVNRLEGEKGFCGVGVKPRVFGAHVHLGEEVTLVPSATIFFSGCTMRCVYCQNAPQSVNADLGEEWSIERIAKWIESMHFQDCKNVNFVGGDPTPNLYAILKALSGVNVPIPVVWNSNAYYSEKTAELLKGIIDIYLLDFRYFSEKCAVKYSSAPNYVEVAKRNFLEAHSDAELLIRLLVIPSHIECCAKPMLEWIAENLGKGVRVNVMDQFYPTHQAYKHPEIDKKLSRLDYVRVLDYARELGLNNLV